MISFDLAHKALIVLAMVMIGLGGFLAWNWLKAHDDAIRLEAQLEASKKQLSDIDAAEKTRQAQLDQAIREIEALKAAVKTPTQAAQQIPIILNPQLPQPVTVNIPEQKPGEAPKPVSIEMPQANLIPFYQHEAECNECKLRATKLEQDRADDAAKLKILEHDRDVAVKAAKGGGFWAKVKIAAKWGIVGAGVSAAAICGSGHCR